MQRQAHSDGLGEQGQVELGDLRRNLGQASSTGAVRTGVELQQGIADLGGPFLPRVGLVGGDQFADQMGVMPTSA
jgi:hypothetical protein